MGKTTYWSDFLKMNVELVSPEQFRKQHLIPPPNERWGIIAKDRRKIKNFVEALSRDIKTDLRERFIPLVEEEDLRGINIKKVLNLEFNTDVGLVCVERGMEIVFNL